MSTGDLSSQNLFFLNDSQNLLNELCLFSSDYKLLHSSCVASRAVDISEMADLLNENKNTLVCAPPRSTDPNYDDKRL